MCLLEEPWLVAGQVQVSGPEHRCNESQDCRDHLELNGPGMLPRRGQDMIKHGCSRKHNNLPRTGKGEHASCGQR